MTDMHTFGDPAGFEISARWVQDQEPRDRLPKEYGWSMGELCIRVAGITLTEHKIHGESKDAIQWYLGPIVAWLLDQWKWLMHEEAYTWNTHVAESAAFTAEADLERYMASEYLQDREVYKKIRAWWARHALRSADPSALFPAIFFRRVEDSIEVSWLDRQPEFAPEGYELNLAPGEALFPVEEVAKPIWEFLRWATTSTAQIATDGDKAQLKALRARFETLRQTRAADLEAAHLTDEILRVVKEESRSLKWTTDRKALSDVPVVTEFDSAVVMFGGLNVDLDTGDVRKLFNVLAQQHGGRDGEKLSELVSSPSIYEYLQPYAHGYELAYQIRAELNIDLHAPFVGIEEILTALGIAVMDVALETASIRGVAIAGKNFVPSIVVNPTHRFNSKPQGRRFSLAHEFCHVLFDRSRAKRLSHISGPWTSGRVEKRANAFAAMFLATPHALERAMSKYLSRDYEMAHQLASEFGIGIGALVEHLRNLDLVSEDEFQAMQGSRYH